MYSLEDFQKSLARNMIGLDNLAGKPPDSIASAFARVEQAQKAIELLQLRIHAWEFRLKHIQQLAERITLRKLRY